MPKKIEPKMSLYQRATAAVVRLMIYEDPESHQQFVIPTEEELAEAEAWAENLHSQGIELIEQDSEEGKSSGRSMLVGAAIQRNQNRASREAAEILRAFATEHTFTLHRPTLLQFYAARNLATQQFPEGTGEGFDSVMASELMPIALGLDSADELDAGDVTMILWARLKAQLHPTTEQLVGFSKRQSVR